MYCTIRSINKLGKQITKICISLNQNGYNYDIVSTINYL